MEFVACKRQRQRDEDEREEQQLIKKIRISEREKHRIKKELLDNSVYFPLSTISHHYNIISYRIPNNTRMRSWIAPARQIMLNIPLVYVIY